MRDTFKNGIISPFFRGLSRAGSFLGLTNSSAASPTIALPPHVNAHQPSPRRQLPRRSRLSAAELSRAHAVDLVRYLQAQKLKGAILTTAEMRGHYSQFCVDNGWKELPWPGPGSMGEQLGRICRRGSTRRRINGKVSNVKTFEVPRTMIRALRGALTDAA